MSTLKTDSDEEHVFSSPWSIYFYHDKDLVEQIDITVSSDEDGVGFDEVINIMMIIDFRLLEKKRNGCEKDYNIRTTYRNKTVFSSMEDYEEYKKEQGIELRQDNDFDVIAYLDGIPYEGDEPINYDSDSIYRCH